MSIQCVDCTFAETAFSDCRFSDCLFEASDLSLATWRYCTMRLVEFQQAKCVGIDWTRVTGSSLTRGTPFAFDRCVLTHTTFLGMKLQKLQIKDCEAGGADFREADLTGADFGRTNLKDSLFQNTNLSKANLQAAKNYHIDPTANTLTGAKFKLPEAMGLLYALDIELG